MTVIIKIKKDGQIDIENDKDVISGEEFKGPNCDSCKDCVLSSVCQDKTGKKEEKEEKVENEKQSKTALEVGVKYNRRIMDIAMEFARECKDLGIEKEEVEKSYKAMIEAARLACLMGLHKASINFVYKEPSDKKE